MSDRIRILLGRVCNKKMNKSVVVSIERLIKHSTYEKFIKRTTKLHVHDPNNETNVGDLVEVQECRPISKTKSWILTSIIKKSNF
ncbi:30S ribosomal subunit protein S17 [Candidatus Blochmanniella pennsylvanica str. BPEN]|uniref:Small ribosomal subunit protein uS17 n=2 Tax=Candidatus Blochmanniella TaxID=203804 RepID=RS17_BLOPB|nr:MULTISPECIES: 30S ribosomal protein S17 [Blochmannia]Q493J9.1 RecName: Full=Small ribosomal subunit protein uS17; AltName: Full=30S ribosomal protein S17 [Candidatus Blochmannia pennsylvanicus str. BPEN]AAZ40841.1 30S ribosomal subunit protein S17 [Candidatus Blochmannia pennsylvanicus str. BPEN]AGC03483.1 30S ribosomal protein S17 [Candidatus Blochmannia chromaiodes str. 640]UOY04611.1 30S ribosomal protein S17 [Candidatus Blochmannia pennsylvanicus]